MEFKPRLKVYKGSNGKNVFNPEKFEATSYSWWVYVRKIKNRVVFNDYSYSKTTNKHQHEMQYFLRTELKVENIIFVNQKQSLTNGLFLDSDYGTLALAEFRLSLPNRKPQFYVEQKNIIDNCKKQIAILKKLGAESKTTLISHRANAKEVETLRLERQREKSLIARKKRQAVVNEFKSQYESTASIEV